jgi:hypothetical protein
MTPLLAMMSGMITLASLNEIPVSDTTTETVSPLRVVKSPLVRDALGKEAAIM